MDHHWRKHYKHHPHPPLFYAVCYFVSMLSVCLLSVSVATNTKTNINIRARSTTTASFICSDDLCPLTTYMYRTHPSIQMQETKKKEEIIMGWASSSSSRSRGRRSRRYLRGKGVGPGSSPPRCISKCERCTPCKPVHVPVPPGTPVTAEYYPEAWRCKCGNKLYMP